MLGKVASANGKLDRKANEVMRDLSRNGLTLREDEELIVLKVFQKASHGVGDIAQLAERFAEAAGNRPKLYYALIETLVFVALLDGDISDAERALIESVCEVFQIPTEEFDRLRRTREKAKETATLIREELEQQQTEAQRRLRQKFKESTTSIIDRSYALLGLSASDDTLAIKKRYQQLVFEKHPDRVALREKNEARLMEAREEFQRILQAYSLIRRERKF